MWANPVFKSIKLGNSWRMLVLMICELNLVCMLQIPMRPWWTGNHTIKQSGVTGWCMKLFGISCHKCLSWDWWQMLSQMMAKSQYNSGQGRVSCTEHREPKLHLAVAIYEDGGDLIGFYQAREEWQMEPVSGGICCSATMTHNIYDHIIYEWWGPVYLASMNRLEQTAPEIRAEFVEGNFMFKGNQDISARSQLVKPKNV